MTDPSWETVNLIGQAGFGCRMVWANRLQLYRLRMAARQFMWQEDCFELRGLEMSDDPGKETIMFALIAMVFSSIETWTDGGITSQDDWLARV
jgi:hypothetical protein